MQLFLCEKPSQARDIAKVLGASCRSGVGALVGKGVTVTWCFGHLLEMAQPDVYGEQYRRWQLATLPIVPAEWRYNVRKDARKQFTLIKGLLREASEVIIATDADREGEVIAREILALCRYRGAIRRLWLSALDQDSIRKALNNLLPGNQTQPLYYAGLARARADWLVGMNLTRAYTVLGRNAGFDTVLSVGRVQTPTLRLVVDRDKAIEAFEPMPFFTVDVQCLTTRQETFHARWLAAKSPAEVTMDEQGRCLDKQFARSVAAKVAQQNAQIRSIESREKTVAPPLGFDLSTLQTQASAKWGYSAEKTLILAQSLYEVHKVCTYPRTDCPYLPVSQFSEAEKVLRSLVKTDPAIGWLVKEANASIQSRTWNQQKVDQAAHHGIMPTTVAYAIDKLSADERNIYDLIRRSYIAQFYPDHQYRQTDVLLHCQGETFAAKGKVILVMGWRQVIEPDKDDANRAENSAQVLPELHQGQAVTVSQAAMQQKQTQPPQRFTEGTLIAAMKSVGRWVDDPALKKILRDTAGIGQEATRAGIIKLLFKRNYLQNMNGKKSKQIVSTETGRKLIDALPPEAKDPATTALWEQALDDIAQGAPFEDFLKQQTQWVSALVRQVVKDGLILGGRTTQKE